MSSEQILPGIFPEKTSLEPSSAPCPLAEGFLDSALRLPRCCMPVLDGWGSDRLSFYLLPTGGVEHMHQSFSATSTSFVGEKDTTIAGQFQQQSDQKW